MRPERQQIAIAEACGWTDCVFVKSLGDCKGIPPEGFKGDPIHRGTRWCWLPDFLRDLNAMREAAMTLSGDELRCYRQHLDRICGNDIVAPIAAMDATAAQRAEAFLRMIGKWTE